MHTIQQVRKQSFWATAFLFLPSSHFKETVCRHVHHCFQMRRANSRSGECIQCMNDFTVLTSVMQRIRGILDEAIFSIPFQYFLMGLKKKQQWNTDLLPLNITFYLSPFLSLESSWHNGTPLSANVTSLLESSWSCWPGFGHRHSPPYQGLRPPPVVCPLLL